MSMAMHGQHIPSEECSVVPILGYLEHEGKGAERGFG